MELTGFIGAVLIIRNLFAGRLTAISMLFFAAVLAEYAFLRFCATKRWYPIAHKSAGIGLHFEKAMVPTSYILACSTWCFLLTRSAVPLVIAIMLLIVVLHVNVILLYLHRKDHDITCVNAYSTPQSSIVLCREAALQKSL